MKKTETLVFYPILVLSLIFVLNISCNKDDDNEKNNNNLGVPELTTMPVTDVTDTSASSGGNITTDDGVAIIERGVCWSTSTNPTIEDSKTSDGTGAGDYVSSITGLSPNTKYYVRAYATNNNGTGYGNAVSFTTDEDSPVGNFGSFTDPRDGAMYKTIIIGDQEWFAENLKFLPSVFRSNMNSSTSPRYYVYGYNGINVTEAKATSNFNTYGVLYNWPAAVSGSASSTSNPSGIRGACPQGWHLPSREEWEQLIDYLGGGSQAGGKLKEEGTAHWNSPNTNANNESWFTGLPGGFRSSTIGFQHLRSYGYWWSTTDQNLGNDEAYNQVLFHNSSNSVGQFHLKESGYSIRCVKD
ncbi:MAG: fibrobacter succinogenes major paralogous domain-containing protein [Cryomorphaceae bacterium]|nr:fibrobacter succinogenes major paralogous domain-containing protein [Cryomorphaceae bacterium]